MYRYFISSKSSNLTHSAYKIQSHLANTFGTRFLERLFSLRFYQFHLGLALICRLKIRQHWCKLTFGRICDNFWPKSSTPYFFHNDLKQQKGPLDNGKSASTSKPLPRRRWIRVQTVGLRHQCMLPISWQHQFFYNFHKCWSYYLIWVN